MTSAPHVAEPAAPKPVPAPAAELPPPRPPQGGFIALTCGNCGYKIAVGSPYCPQCQAVFAAAPPVATTQATPAKEEAPAKTHVSQIIIMWVVTFVAWVHGAEHDPMVIVCLIDVIPFILAVDLVRQKSGMDRLNGMLKLALELVGFFVALSGGLAASLGLSPAPQ